MFVQYFNFIFTQINEKFTNVYKKYYEFMFLLAANMRFSRENLLKILFENMSLKIMS